MRYTINHNFEVGTVLILQIGKLRPRKVKKFVERCTTSSTPNVVLLHNDTNHMPFNQETEKPFTRLIYLTFNLHF